jgi:hypothetical protein
MYSWQSNRISQSIKKKVREIGGKGFLLSWSNRLSRIYTRYNEVYSIERFVTPPSSLWLY